MILDCHMPQTVMLYPLHFLSQHRQWSVRPQIQQWTNTPLSVGPISSPKNHPHELNILMFIRFKRLGTSIPWYTWSHPIAIALESFWDALGMPFVSWLLGLLHGQAHLATVNIHRLNAHFDLDEATGSWTAREFRDEKVLYIHTQIYDVLICMYVYVETEREW